MSSTTSTPKPPTIGVELEFLVVNIPETHTDEEASSKDDRRPPVPNPNALPKSTDGKDLSKDKRWPPVPNPNAHSESRGTETMLEICKFLKDQRHQVACVYHDADSQDPSMAHPDGDSQDPSMVYPDGDSQDQSMAHPDGYLVREVKTSDDQFEIRRFSFDSDKKMGENDTDYRVWNTKLDYNSPKKLPLRFTIWNFQSEHTVGSKSSYPPVEMRTPIMSEEKQQKEFLDIVDALRTNFKISINRNCGMHIHAGYESDPPKPVDDLNRAKKVAAIVFMLEKPFLCELCHPARRGAQKRKLIGEDSVCAKMARNPRHRVSRYPGFEHLIECIRQFRGRLENRSSKEAFVFRFLEVLFSDTKIGKQGSEIFKKSLDEKEGTRTSLTLKLDIKTMEFRYFESIFDTNMIEFWIAFVKKIFSICNKPEAQFENEFKDLYEMATRKQKPGWEDWLEKLGLSQYEETCTSYLKRCKELPLDASVILPKSFDKREA